MTLVLDPNFFLKFSQISDRMREGLVNPAERYMLISSRGFLMVLDFKINIVSVGSASHSRILELIS